MYTCIYVRRQNENGIKFEPGGSNEGEEAVSAMEDWICFKVC